MAELPGLVVNFIANVEGFLASVASATEATNAFAAEAEAAGARVDASFARLGEVGRVVVAENERMAASYNELGATADRAATGAAAAMDRVAGSGNVVIAENERLTASYAEVEGAAGRMSAQVTADESRLAAGDSEVLAGNTRLVESYTQVGAAAERAGTQAGAAYARMSEGSAAAAAENQRLVGSYTEVGAVADRAGTQAATVGARAAEGSAAATAANQRLAGSEAEVGAAAEVAGAKAATTGEKAAAGAGIGIRANNELGASFAGMGLKAEASGAGASRALGFIGIAAAGVGYETLKMAGNFQQATDTFVTTAGEDRGQLEMVRQKMLELSTTTGTSAQSMVQSMYLVESSHIHGAAAVNVLRAAVQGAKIENADLTKTTDALTTTITDFHFKTDEASTVMSKLVAAVGGGKLSMEQMAGSLHTVENVAGNAGLSLDQTAAALATLTMHGQSADQATQNLSNAIRNLEAPNAVATKEMAGLGINALDLSSKLGERGLSGTYKVLTEAIANHTQNGHVVLDLMQNSAIATEKYTRAVAGAPPEVQKMATALHDGSMSLKDYTKDAKGMGGQSEATAVQLLPLIQHSLGFSDAVKNNNADVTTFMDVLKRTTGGATGLAVALGLTGENAVLFQQNIDAVSAATTQADGNVAHWDDVNQRFNQHVDVAKESLRNMGIAIGTDLMPAVGAIIGVLGGMAGWLAQNQVVAGILAGVIGGALTLAILAYTAKMVVAAATTVTWMVSGLAQGVAWAAGKIAQYTGVGAAAESSASTEVVAAEQAAAGTRTAATAEAEAVAASTERQVAATRAGQLEIVAAIRTGMAEVVAAIRAGGVESVAAYAATGTEEAAAVRTAGTEIVLAHRTIQAESAAAVRTSGAEVALAGGEVGREAGARQATVFVESVRVGMAEAETVAAESVRAGGVGVIGSAATVGAEAGTAESTAMAESVAAGGATVGAAGATAAGTAATATRAGWLSRFAGTLGTAGLVLFAAKMVDDATGGHVMDTIHALVDHINHAFTGEAFSPATQATDAQFARISNAVRENLGLAAMYSADGTQKIDTSITQGSATAADASAAAFNRLSNSVRTSMGMAAQWSDDGWHRLDASAQQGTAQAAQAAETNLPRIPQAAGQAAQNTVSAWGTGLAGLPQIVAGPEDQMRQNHQVTIDRMQAASHNGISAISQSTQDYKNNVPPKMNSADMTMAQQHQGTMDRMQAQSVAGFTAMQGSAGAYAGGIQRTMTPAEAGVQQTHQVTMDTMQAKSRVGFSAMQQDAQNWANSLPKMAPPEAAAAQAHQQNMDNMQAKSQTGFTAMAQAGANYSNQLPKMTPAENAVAQAHQDTMDRMHGASVGGFAAMQGSAQNFAAQFPPPVHQGGRQAEEDHGQNMTAMGQHTTEGMTRVATAGATGIGQFHRSISDGSGAAEQRTGQIPGNMQQGLSALSGDMNNAGNSAMQGFFNGLESLAGTIMSWVSGFVSQMVAAMQSALSMHSPSQVMHGLGQNTMQGLLNGLASQEDPLRRQMDILSKIVLSAGQGMSVSPSVAAGALDGLQAQLGVQVTSSALTAMAPALTASSGGSSSPTAGTSGGNTIINVTVQGTVVDSAGLFRELQEQTLRYGGRNTGDGLSLGSLGHSTGRP